MILQEKLRELIAAGKTKSALDALATQLKNTDEGDTLILLQARWNGNQNANNQGIIDRDHYNREIANINRALLSVIGDLDDALTHTPQSPAQQKAIQAITNIYNTYITDNSVKKTVDVNGHGNTVITDINGSTVTVNATPQTDSQKTDEVPQKQVILFIAAEPESKQIFNAGKELKIIQNALEKSSFREKYVILNVFATDFGDLPRLLTKHKPTMVHLSMHGSQEGVFFQTEAGEAVEVDARSLSRLFKLLKQTGKKIQCVVISACESAAHAQTIHQFVPHTIGMDGFILADAAIAYTKGFYQQLFETSDYAASHPFGVWEIEQFERGIKPLDSKSKKQSDMPKYFSS
jgi:Effector-associated domain 11